MKGQTKVFPHNPRPDTCITELHWKDEKTPDYMMHRRVKGSDGELIKTYKGLDQMSNDLFHNIPNV